jgi:hypothetical protein
MNAQNGSQIFVEREYSGVNIDVNSIFDIENHPVQSGCSSDENISRNQRCDDLVIEIEEVQGDSVVKSSDILQGSRLTSEALALQGIMNYREKCKKFIVISGQTSSISDISCDNFHAVAAHPCSIQTVEKNNVVHETKPKTFRLSSRTIKHCPDCGMTSVRKANDSHIKVCIGKCFQRSFIYFNFHL